MRRLFQTIESANRRYVVIAFIFVSASLALLLSGVIRAYILPPIQYLFWWAVVIYETLPQLFWWTIFLLVLMVVAAWSLIIRRNKKFSGECNHIVHTSRLEYWVDTIEKSNKGSYFACFLAHELSLLSLKVFSTQERLSSDQVSDLISSNKIELPLEIQKYIQNGLDVQKSFQNTRSSIWPFSTNRFVLPDVETEKLIKFLEEKVDIEYEKAQ